ncbi:helix-turn-helix transcriptional regulator [Micromonospora sp. NPDC047730]|uniref:helix-turn-helix transcriptional regulator n=1 Tax=Micromonospora sp. NPDC047730 TaxID=3364253 RepID=UPI003719D0C6
MPDHLYGPQEIADRLGVSRERVRQLTLRADWPAPYDRLAMGTVWRIADVEAWIRKHRPHLGEAEAE